MRRFTLYLRIGFHKEDQKENYIPKKVQNLKKIFVELENVSKNDPSKLFDAVTKA
jgi:hypothetical protein